MKWFHHVSRGALQVLTIGLGTAVGFWMYERFSKASIQASGTAPGVGIGMGGG